MNNAPSLRKQLWKNESRNLVELTVLFSPSAAVLWPIFCVLGGRGTEGPLQVCQMSSSLESAHFVSF